MHGHVLRSLALTILFANQLSAQLQWESTPGPYGGRLTSLVRASSGILYTVGTGSVFRSRDEGASWVVAGPRVAGLDAAIMMATPGGALLATRYPDSIFRSTDRGATWAPVHGWSAHSYPIAPFTTDVSDRIFVASDSGIDHSTDDGVSWRPWARDVFVVGNLVADDIYLYSSRLRLSLTNPRDTLTLVLPFGNHVLAIDGDGALWATAPSFGVYRSSDHGASWQKRDSGVTGDAYSRVVTLADSSLIVSTREVLFRSTDDGERWDTLALADALQPFAIVQTSADRIVMAIGNGILRSTDRGHTWSASNSGIRAAVIEGLGGDVAGTTTYVLASAQQGSSTNALARTTDNGRSWWTLSLPSGSYISAFTVDASGKVYVAPYPNTGPTIIIASTDRGSSWSFDTVDQRFIAISSMAARGDTLILGNGIGDAFTRIGTTPWVRAHTDFHAGGVTVGIDSSGGLLIATGQGLFRSTDGGVSFNFIAAAPGLYDGSNRQTLVVAPDGFIHHAQKSRMNRIDLSRQMVDKLTPIGERYAITSLAFLTANTYLIGTERDGVWLSGRNGVQRANDGIEIMLCLALFTDQRGHAWCGTDGAGVFTTQTDPLSAPVDRRLPTLFDLSSFERR